MSANARAASSSRDSGMRRPGRRLGRQDVGPDIAGRRLRQQRGAVLAEGGGDRRVELAAGAALDGRDRRRRAAQAVEQHRHVGDMRDAHRQGERLPGQAPRPALAIPALEDLRERSLHARRQPEAAGHRGPHLAVGGLHLPLAPLALRQDAGDEPGALQHAPVGSQLEEQEPSHVPRVAQVGFGAGGAQGDIVAARRGGILVRGGGAAAEAQEGRVVDVADLVLAEAQPAREADAEQRGPQRVLRREGHPQIRRQRERGEHIREPERPGARPRRVLPARDASPPMIALPSRDGAASHCSPTQSTPPVNGRVLSLPSGTPRDIGLSRGFPSDRSLL